jgi:hypothetical protein
MKKLLLALLILAMANMGYAASLVCDPQEDVTHYRIDGTEIVAAEADGSVIYNVDSIAEGEHNKTLEAGRAYTLDGTEQEAIKWSDPVPFVLGVPQKPLLPTNTSLVP